MCYVFFLSFFSTQCSDLLKQVLRDSFQSRNLFQIAPTFLEKVFHPGGQNVKLYSLFLKKI